MDRDAVADALGRLEYGERFIAFYLFKCYIFFERGIKRPLATRICSHTVSLCLFLFASSSNIRHIGGRKIPYNITSCMKTQPKSFSSSTFTFNQISFPKD